MIRSLYPMIDDERIGQYASKDKATAQAKIESRHTGVRHRMVMSVTYRDLEPRMCWTVMMEGDKRLRPYGGGR